MAVSIRWRERPLYAHSIWNDWLALTFGLLVLSGSAAIAAAGAAEASSAPIVIGADFSAASLGGHMAMLRDPSAGAHLEDVAFGALAGQFTALPDNLSLGYVADVVWLRIDIDDRALESGPVFLDLEPAFLEDVRIFVPIVTEPKNQNNFHTIFLGTHVPLVDRPVLATSLVAPLRLMRGTRNVVYLRIATTSAMALRGDVLSPAEMATHATLQTLQYGMFQGIFLLVCVANLLYWNRLGDRTYLAYGAFLGAQSLLIWCNAGLVPLGVLPYGGLGVDRLTKIAVCANHAFGAWFVLLQTDARRNSPWIGRILFLLSIACGLAMVPTLFGAYRFIVQPMLASGVLIFVLAMICNARAAWRGLPGGTLATLACLGQLCGIVATVGRLVGLIPVSILTDHFYEAGSLIFTVYMTIALADRARTAETERRIAERQALALALSSEQQAQSLVERRTSQLVEARDRAEAALAAERQAQDEQVRFVDVVSHQYRTPLAVMRSTVSAIGLSLPPDDCANRERLERIKRAIARLVDIIDVNLHSSRIDGLVTAPDIRAVTLGPWLGEVVERTRDLYDNRDIVLDIEEDGVAASADLDPNMLGLALANLIENAHKFSPPGLPVEVGCRRRDGSVVLRVLDRGMGIPLEERTRITQKYFRASNAGHTAGMGLGLHMVQAIVRVHRGQMTIESQTGSGTMVTLTLPERHI